MYIVYIGTRNAKQLNVTNVKYYMVYMEAECIYVNKRSYDLFIVNAIIKQLKKLN